MAQLRQTWDNSDFYTSSQDPRIAKTVEDMKRAIATLADLCVPFLSTGQNPENL